MKPGAGTILGIEGKKCEWWRRDGGFLGAFSGWAWWGMSRHGAQTSSLSSATPALPWPGLPVVPCPHVFSQEMGTVQTWVVFFEMFYILFQSPKFCLEWDCLQILLPPSMPGGILICFREIFPGSSGWYSHAFVYEHPGWEFSRTEEPVWRPRNPCLL